MVPMLLVLLGLLALSGGCGDAGPTDTRAMGSAGYDADGDSDPTERDPSREETRDRRNTDPIELEAQLPPDTATAGDPRGRVQVTIPASWRLLGKPWLAPGDGVLAVAAGPLTLGACSKAPDQPRINPDSDGAFLHVGLQAKQDPRAGGPQPRPWRLLRQVKPVDSDRPASGQVLPWKCLSRVGVVGRWTFFGAAGGVYYVTAFAGEGTSSETRRHLLGTMQSLEFER